MQVERAARESKDSTVETAAPSTVVVAIVIVTIVTFNYVDGDDRDSNTHRDKDSNR